MRTLDRIPLRLAAVVTTLLLSALPVHAQRAVQPPSPDSMAQMYAAGVDFDTFLANAESRRTQWQGNWSKSDPAAEFVDRARALQGRYRLLVVAIDTCSDSVNTVPYLARLAERVEQLELSVVDPDTGEMLMDLYRTPDHRGATPTVAILDENYVVVGTWVERPAALQDWWLDHPEIRISEKARRKQGWYDWDEGHSTYTEIVALLEAADARR